MAEYVSYLISAESEDMGKCRFSDFVHITQNENTQRAIQ